MIEELQKLLESHGITATRCHTGSGEPILRLPNDLTLMIMVEVYDQEDGNHQTVKLDELADTITHWRD